MMPRAPVEQGTIQENLLFKGQVDQKKKEKHYCFIKIDFVLEIIIYIQSN